jgi:ubiquinone/menaquinone biosynthesis C-methylase UbiE
MKSPEFNFAGKVSIGGEELSEEKKQKIEKENPNFSFATAVPDKKKEQSQTSATEKDGFSAILQTQENIDEKVALADRTTNEISADDERQILSSFSINSKDMSAFPVSNEINFPNGSILGKGGKVQNFGEKEGTDRLDADSVRTFFTADIPKGYETYDFLKERCEKLLQKEDLSKDEKLTVLDTFCHIMSESFKNPELGIDIPEDLKEKLLSDPSFLNKFIGFVPSYLVEMDDIVDLTEDLSPEGQKFIWHIFHKKFDSLSNRSLESFGFPKTIMEEIINEEILQFPNESIVILDAGCGENGTAIRELKEKYKEKIIAIGVDKDLREESTDNVILKEADIRKMPFADNFFHFVYEVGVAGYLKKNKNDLESFVSEDVRILKNGGKLLLTDIGADGMEFLQNLNVTHTILPKTGFLLITKNK